MKKNSSVKWFTLVEMLIVLVIIFIMINAIKTILSFSQRDFINSQTCANKASSRIIGQLNNALTSKSVFSWATKFSPQSYWVNIFSTWIIGYVYSWVDKVVLPDYSIVLSWNDTSISSECYSKNYKLVASWNIDSIEMKKWLSFDQKDVFVITGWLIGPKVSLLTWEIKFLQCVWTAPCKDLSKITADKRSLSIVQTKCTKWSWEKCVSVGY